MPKMRERCASHSGRRPSLRGASRRVLGPLLAVALVIASASPAGAAARRIVLIHADPELTRSVNLALYPWDLSVVEVDEPAPDATSPDAIAAARALAKRHSAAAIAWIDRTDEAATLWFFDASTDSLRSRPLPISARPDADPAQLAAVALTLKTLVRATPWESRIPTVIRERKGAGWESRLELDVLGRAPVSGASGEPRLGLWVSEWYGTPALLWGAAVGASAGLGMTYDDSASHDSLQDIDVRAALRARLRLGRRFFFEPKLGMSAHVERAAVSTTSPATTETFTRVDPSVDAGLSLGWQVTDAFAWSVGIEALELVRYQRWLAGSDVVFAPSSLWIQGGSSITWSFR